MPSEEFLAFVASLRDNPMPTELVPMREAYEAMGTIFTVAQGVRTARATLGDRPAEWYVPDTGPQNGILLYLHGGGYAIGSINTHRHLVSEMARQTGCAAVAIDYRLGPEFPFPAAVEDALSAYRQLVAESPDLPIALAGDSAGGGLVVATLLGIAATDLQTPAGAYCMSPWVDLAVTGESVGAKEDVDPLASRQTLMTMADRYLAGSEPTDPRASPIFGNLAGLPPLFIQAGSAEVLLDDSIRLARAAGLADVNVCLEISSHMIHVWPYFFPVFPEGLEALEKGCRFLSRQFGNDM